MGTSVPQRLLGDDVNSLLVRTILSVPCEDSGCFVPPWPPVPLCLFLPLAVELTREQGLGAAPSCSTELGEERVEGR